jgi:hypothetical protein
MATKQELDVEDQQVDVRLGERDKPAVERSLDRLERIAMDQVGKPERAARAQSERVCDHHFLGMAPAEFLERVEKHLALLGRTGAIERVGHHRVGIEQAKHVRDVRRGRRRAGGRQVGDQAVVGAALCRDGLRC